MKVNDIILEIYYFLICYRTIVVIEYSYDHFW